MVAEGPEDDLLLDPFREVRKQTRSRWGTFFRFLVYTTFAIAFLFLFISIVLVLDPAWGASLTQPVNPFFFVFLAIFFLPPVELLSVFIVMFALYIVFFIAIIYQSGRERKKNVLDTPIGFFVAAATAVELVALIISQIESHFGTPVGGGGIDSQLQNNPLLGYMSLIYAPFVEELGFRILPLGAYSFFLVLYASARMHRYSLKDALMAILLPGHMRRKYDLRLGGVDWILILATSLIFGYAHIFFGAWDWGKFIPVFVTGVALAIGFLKFGAYVDIPFHWFFNGFLTVFYLDQSLLIPIGLLTLWILFVGAVSIVAIAVYAKSRGGRTTSPA